MRRIVKHAEKHLLIDRSPVIGSIESNNHFVGRSIGYQFKCERITIYQLFYNCGAHHLLKIRKCPNKS